MRAGEDPGAGMTTTAALLAHRTTGVRRAGAIALGVLALLLAIGCSGPTLQPKPSASSVDWQALGAAVETAIQGGETQGLDNIRAVLVSVDGKIQLEHYRNGFSADDHEHVWSVTKSVVATLIGIAIDDGLIPSVDQPLSVLLPEHRKAMTPTASQVTLRQLMSMSGGFAEEDWSLVLYERDKSGDDDFIDYLLKLGPRHEPGTSFEYSNTSAHLAAAVLASALARSKDPPRQTLLDYARANLFEPRGIQSEPASTENIAPPARPARISSPVISVDRSSESVWNRSTARLSVPVRLIRVPRVAAPYASVIDESRWITYRLACAFAMSSPTAWSMLRMSGLPPALLLVMRPPLISTMVFRPGMNESVCDSFTSSFSRCDDSTSRYAARPRASARTFSRQPMSTARSPHSRARNVDRSRGGRMRAASYSVLTCSQRSGVMLCSRKAARYSSSRKPPSKDTRKSASFHLTDFAAGS